MGELTLRGLAGRIARYYDPQSDESDFVHYEPAVREVLLAVADHIDTAYANARGDSEYIALFSFANELRRIAAGEK